MVPVWSGFRQIEEKNAVSSVPSGPPIHVHAPRGGVGGNRLKVVRLGVAILWTLLIMVLCWIPRGFVHKIEEESSWFRLPSLDKVIHFGMFVVLAILWRRYDSSRRAIGAIVLGGVALGVLTELGQLLPVVSRNADLYDVVMDGIGLAIGVAIAPYVEPLLGFFESRLGRVLSPRTAARVEQ
jgi:hypothetical protein